MRLALNSLATDKHVALRATHMTMDPGSKPGPHEGEASGQSLLPCIILHDLWSRGDTAPLMKEWKPVYEQQHFKVLSAIPISAVDLGEGPGSLISKNFKA